MVFSVPSYYIYRCPYRAQACGLCGGIGCGTVNGTGGAAFCCPTTIRENGEVRAKDEGTDVHVQHLIDVASGSLGLLGGLFNAAVGDRINRCFFAGMRRLDWAGLGLTGGVPILRQR